MTASDFRFQISDFRSQALDPAEFLLSDFRFQISDPKPSTQQNFFFQISDFRFQISDRPVAEILLERRSQNTQNTFQDCSSEFCWAQISDFRSQNSRGGLEQARPDFRFQISDFRNPSMPSHRFQISDFRKQRSRAKSQRKGDFRFQISDF